MVFYHNKNSFFFWEKKTYFNSTCQQPSRIKRFVSGGLIGMDICRAMVEIIKLRRIGAAISVSQYPLGDCRFANIISSARRNFASSSLLLLLFFLKKENIYD
jgi:hypothetical protein